MEEKKGMKGCCDNCGNCDSGSCAAYGQGQQCGCGGWHRRCGMGHAAIRIFIGLVIVGLTFMAGVRLGELKAALYGFDGGRGMMGGKYSDIMRNKFFYNADPYEQGWMMGGYSSDFESKAVPSGTANPAR